MVGVQVFPVTRQEIGGCAEVCGQGRECRAGRDRNQAGVGLEVEKCVVDPGGGRRDAVVEAGSREHFAVEEGRLLDGEVHRAGAAGPERLQIDSVGQHDQVAAAQQLPVARLVHHGLPHRKQDDRDTDAERVAAQQQRTAPRSLAYRGPDEAPDHGVVLPSTTSIVRLAPAASSRS